MINEVYKLSKTLEDMQIDTEKWHDSYKELPKVTPKTPCYCIRLAADGSVCVVETLPHNVVNTLRKYGKPTGTGGSFPAMNLTALYRLGDEGQRKRFDEIEKHPEKASVEEIKSLCAVNNWFKKEEQFWKSIHERSEELISIIGRDHIIGTLAEITAQYDSLNAFRYKLEEYLFEQIAAKTNVSQALALLIYKGNPKNDDEPVKDAGTNISVILDVADYRRFENPVANAKTTDLVNQLLTEATAKSSSEKKSSDKIDAFGEPYVDVGKPMPEVKLAGGFSAKLRAMFTANGDQGCQYRYSKAEEESFLINEQNRQQLKSSLEYISEIDKKNIFWVNTDKDEIVFAYPDKLPPMPIKFIELFSGDKTNKQTSIDEERFEQISHNFLASLNGLKPNQKPKSIQLFCIKKMNKASSKVIYNNSITVEAMLDSATNWQAGCENLPPLDRIEAVTPFPLQVAAIANKVWKYNGETASTDKSQAKLMRYFNGMDLLLEPVGEQLLLHYLRGIISNNQGLISYVGGSLPISGNKRSKRQKLQNTHTAAIGDIFPLIGLLLYKSGIKKEIYMENMAFLLGRILKLSDGLHELYCEVKRDGDVPPQLAGNALFASASETPCRALAQLGLRMAPYMAWASKYITLRDENGEPLPKWGLVIWYKRLFNETVDKLNQCLSDTTRFNDYEKAQLFIGYMASLPKKNKEENDTETDNNINSNIKGEIIK